MSTRAALTGIVVLLVALVGSLSASAAFPGTNGKIVFGSQHAGEDEIWVMNADGSNRHNLTRHDGAKISDIDPRWSPDGQRIVYASDDGGTFQIWVMNANGTGQTKLTNLAGRNRRPAFTADGNQIVFQSGIGSNAEIYRMNADGSDLMNLTNNPGFDGSPATASRGKRIVFARATALGDGDLYIWSPDEPLKQVTSGPASDSQPNWSPSGNNLVFSRFVNDQTEIYSAHADGTGERRLTNTTGLTEFFPAYSPDGKKIVYTRCGAPKPAGAPNPVCSTHIMNIDGTGDVDLVSPTPETDWPFADDFDDNTRNVDYWSLIHDGTGGTVAEQNGRIEFTLAEDAAPSPGAFPAIRVSYDFKCIVEGDFDAQVDYQLLEWPEANGTFVQLQAFFADANVARQSQSWGESYAAFVGPSSFNAAGTTDLSGTLRLVREGATFTAYYRDGASWITLVSAAGSEADALLVLGLASFGSFGGEQVKIAFDNFRLDADEEDVDCSSSRPDLHPDVQPLGR